MVKLTDTQEFWSRLVEHLKFATRQLDGALADPSYSKRARKANNKKYRKQLERDLEILTAADVRECVALQRAFIATGRT